MMTLIKRELTDMSLFLLASAAAATAFAAVLIMPVFDIRMNRDFWEFLVTCLPVMSVVFAAALGVSQMYFDRMRGVSTFLCTHSVRKEHIFAARCIAGLIIILVWFVPAFLAVQWTFAYHWPVIFPALAIFHKISAVFFLGLLAAYSLGLSRGWTSGKIMPTLGTLVLLLPLMTLVIVKGFCAELMLLLAVLAAACLCRAWSVYKSSSL